MWTESRRCAHVGRLGVIGGNKARANEEEIADLYVTSLGSGTEIETLGLSTGLELSEGDGVIFVWI